MSVENFKSLEDFAARAPGVTKARVNRLGSRVASRVVNEGAIMAVHMTPVGPSEEAERRKRDKSGSVVYGHMSENWHKVTGDGAGRIPPEVPIKVWPGEKARIVNRAAHARVIDRGRKTSTYVLKRHKRYKPGTKRRDYGAEQSVTRMLGSPQAANGISKPLVDWLEAKRDEFIQQEIQREEAAK